MGALLLGVGGAVVLLIDGVEQVQRAPDLVAGLWLSLARWPGRVVGLLPVLAAGASAVVTARWARQGQLTALEVCGVAPDTLARPAILAGLLLVLVGVVGREVVAEPAAQILAPQGAWIAAGNGEKTQFIRAKHLDAVTARDVNVVTMTETTLVTPFHADVLVFEGGRWRLPSGSTELPALPTPQGWALTALAPGPDLAWLRLWRIEPSPARNAWRADGFWVLFSAMALSATAALYVRRDRDVAVVVALALGVRLVQQGATSAASLGTWSLATAAA